MMKQFILIFGLFAPLTTSATELLMVSEDGCVWCEQWDDDIGDIYPKTKEGKFAPLHRIDIHKVQDDKRFQPSIVFTPTFIILEDGAEVARIEGYPGEDFFWQLLNQALLKHSKYKETEK